MWWCWAAGRAAVVGQRQRRLCALQFCCSSPSPAAPDLLFRLRAAGNSYGIGRQGKGQEEHGQSAAGRGRMCQRRAGACAAAASAASQQRRRAGAANPQCCHRRTKFTRCGAELEEQHGQRSLRKHARSPLGHRELRRWQTQGKRFNRRMGMQRATRGPAFEQSGLGPAGGRRMLPAVCLHARTQGPRSASASSWMRRCVITGNSAGV